MQPAESAAARWQRLVSDRLQEMERLAPGLGSAGGAYWDRHAGAYAAAMRCTEADRDPFLRRLRRLTQPSSTVVDVGAGTGRFTLPLAASVRRITAVDPSAAMLAILRRNAGEMGVTNLTTFLGTWQAAPCGPADLVFSSMVLTLVPDARAFLIKLDGAARRHVLLYLGAYSADAVLDPLWRHFHDAPRAPGATYLDALAVLRELGAAPGVKVVELANRRRFATLDDAVSHYRGELLLADTPDITSELARLLSSWLLGRSGTLRSPLRSMPAAIIQWQPGLLTARQG